MVSISSDIFANKFSLIVFISYMVLFINQGILVTASKAKDNSYTYNTVTVVLFTEVLKLTVATLLFLKDNAVSQVFKDVVKHIKVLCLQFFPSALYCVHNNLQFINLSAYDPTTYYLLLQFKVVAVAIIFRCVLKKQLSHVQWISLLVLTLACIIKDIWYNASQIGNTARVSPASILDYIDINLVLIILQAFSSCIIGVYNEFVFKDYSKGIHIMMVNIFLYLNSTVCNILVLALQGEWNEAFIDYNLNAIWKPAVIFVIINNAVIGLVSSAFLYSLNSNQKTFASALVLMITAILCWLLFGIPMDMLTVAIIFIVSAAEYMYYQNPLLSKTRMNTELDMLKNGEMKSLHFSGDTVSGHRHKTLMCI